ncbi:MAG: hypothetical protein BGO69_06345 [Bacteroidetes bacterium 46-16]|nr:MAG: hypothetical protein BGO69_06345 [Bacteroidetes bacterium 46-16]
MAGNKKILFLYAHVQPFLLAGIGRLIAKYNAEVLIICWPKADMSPTDITANEKISFLFKTGDNTKTIKDAILNFDPDVVYNVGWMDKDYLRWCYMFKKLGKVNIMAMDTQWQATLKQRINCILGRFIFKSLFSYAWVPGPLQYSYARRLGFDVEHILNNVYAVDTNLFRNVYQKFLPLKKLHYPRAFLYAGRLVEHKFGSLLRAFSTLSKAEKAGWKLIVAGKGPMEDSPPMQAEDIIYKGFLQHTELAALAGEAGVFCLLSTEEPWGMVIQEFAAAGLPILASTQCGAAHTFVKEGVNGYTCDGNDIDGIKRLLLKMIGKDSSELLAMGEKSMQLAVPVNSELWADTLMSVLAEGKDQQHQ